MAEAKEAEKSEKKGPGMMFILQLVFAVVNLGVMGGGAYLVYASTMGWHAPAMTEKGLRRPASVKAPEAAAPAQAEAPAAEAAGHGSGPESTEIVPFLQKLDKFTVNLSGEPKRTIRLEVSLEMLNDESYEEVMEITRMPKIRDRIVAVLNDKSFSDLESIQGKLFLKDKISNEVNSLLDKGVVKDVYFSEFVVQ